MVLRRFLGRGRVFFVYGSGRGDFYRFKGPVVTSVKKTRGGNQNNSRM